MLRGIDPTCNHGSRSTLDKNPESGAAPMGMGAMDGGMAMGAMSGGMGRM